MSFSLRERKRVTLILPISCVVLFAFHYVRQTAHLRNIDMTALLFIYSLGYLYKRSRITEEAVKVENADCCFIAGHWPQRSIFFNPNVGQAVYFLLLWGHLSRILSSPLMTARDCNWVNIVRAFKLRFKFKLILSPSILLGTTVIRIQCRRSMYMNLTGPRKTGPRGQGTVCFLWFACSASALVGSDEHIMVALSDVGS